MEFEVIAQHYGVHLNRTVSVQNYCKLDYNNINLHCCNEEHVERKSKCQYQQDRKVNQLDEINIDIEQHGDRFAKYWDLLQ